MVRYPKVLNIAFAGHIDHGKSSLIGAITGKFPDIYEFEIRKEMTVFMKIISFHYKGVMFNLIDTPGHSDFRFALNLALSIADGIVLVVSGTRGFQAWTEYVLRHAIARKLPVVIAATKADLPNFSIKRIEEDVKQHELPDNIPIVSTSAKMRKGILNLLDSIIENIRPIRRYKTDPKLIIVSRERIPGFKTMYLAKLESGELRVHDKINAFQIKELFDIRKKPIDFTYAGNLIDVDFQENSKSIDPGSIITPKSIRKDLLLLKSVTPLLEYQIKITNAKDAQKIKEILSELSEKIGLKYEIKEDIIKMDAVGGLQYQVLLEKLKEEKVSYIPVKESIKKHITIAERVVGKSGTAKVELIPHTLREYKIIRKGDETKEYDIVGVSTACQAVGITGILAIIHEGENEEDLARATGNCIKRAGLITILPNKLILVRSKNLDKNLDSILISEDIKLSYYINQKAYFLVPSDKLDLFIDNILRITHGKAELRLIKLMPEERILSIDPGTRHLGFAYIRSEKMPILWHINLPANLEIDKKAQSRLIDSIKDEIKLFLKEFDPPNKIFIGAGIGAKFAYKAIEKYIEEQQLKDVEIFYVDETKTTKEAIFRIRSGKIEKVKAESLVDHAVAALIIARRGLEGKRIKVKNVEETIEDYIKKTYSIGNFFRSISSVRSIKDIRPGMFLRVKDPTFLKTNLEKGDVVIFRNWRKEKSFIANTLTGAKIIVKLKEEVNLERDFLNIFQPVKSAR
ncbi:MAG: GTP-binding protein [Candidatus Asgardarchaeia archaeon]